MGEPTIADLKEAVLLLSDWIRILHRGESQFTAVKIDQCVKNILEGRESHDDGK